MKYIMEAGILYADKKMLARLKGVFNSPEKSIFLADGTLALRTSIRSLKIPPEKKGDVRFRNYIMFDKNGRECVLAKPSYATGHEPETAGWPVCRIPKVDHVHMKINDTEFCLFMQNNQSYSLMEESGRTAVRITHRGLIGGWNIEADDGFPPEIICGVFAFCKYMDYENEFLIV